MSAVCKRCKFVKVTDSGSRIWDYRCTHTLFRLTPGVCPVTGRKGYQEKNDLGTAYIEESKFPYCKKVNADGKCEAYRVKRWKP
ncbi:MAG: hypothetical protein GY722_20385 [bacterium]|nr:hypothetical protein [bacterium]